MTLAPLQFPLNGLPNEVSPRFAIGQSSVDPVERPGCETGLHILGPKFFASHAIISHMRY